MTMPVLSDALSRMPMTSTTVSTATMPKARMLKTMGTPKRCGALSRRPGLFAAVLTVVLVIGILESASLNTGMVMLKLVVLGFFVVVGWNYMHPENWQPFPPNGGAGVPAGAAVVFFAYIASH